MKAVIDALTKQMMLIERERPGGVWGIQVAQDRLARHWRRCLWEAHYLTSIFVRQEMWRELR